MDQPMRLVAHDPAWADSYVAEHARVRDPLGERVRRIDHIGSTAVPDLAAKPVIDVRVVTEDMATARACKDPLFDADYGLVHDVDSWVSFRRSDKGQTYNLHVFPTGDSRWRENLLFRDYLRDHPDARRRYESLKRDLLDSHPDDVVAYSRGKTEFVAEVIESAEDAGYGPYEPDG